MWKGPLPWFHFSSTKLEAFSWAWFYGRHLADKLRVFDFIFLSFRRYFHVLNIFHFSFFRDPSFGVGFQTKKCLLFALVVSFGSADCAGEHRKTSVWECERVRVQHSPSWPVLERIPAPDMQIKPATLATMNCLSIRFFSTTFSNPYGLTKWDFAARAHGRCPVPLGVFFNEMNDLIHAFGLFFPVAFAFTHFNVRLFDTCSR